MVLLDLVAIEAILPSISMQKGLKLILGTSTPLISHIKIGITDGYPSALTIFFALCAYPLINNIA